MRVETFCRSGTVRALVLVVGTASAFGTVLLGTPVKSQIAFTSFRNGQWAAYVMNATGSGQRG